MSGAVEEQGGKAAAVKSAMEGLAAAEADANYEQHTVHANPVRR